MTNSEFAQICSLSMKKTSLSIKHKQFNLSGQLVGCWEDSFVIDCNGTYTLWPWELCDQEEPRYHIPSYS